MKKEVSTILVGKNVFLQKCNLLLKKCFFLFFVQACVYSRHPASMRSWPFVLSHYSPFFAGCGILLGIFCSTSNLCFVSARSTEIAIAFLKQFLLVALAPKQAPDRNGTEIINKKYFFSISNFCFVSARAAGITMLCFSYIVFWWPWHHTKKKFETESCT